MDTTQKLKDKYLTRKESASNSSYSVFDKMIIRTASIIKVHSELNKSLRENIKLYENIICKIFLIMPFVFIVERVN